MSKQQTVEQVRSSVHRMFESLHSVMDDVMRRPDLADGVEVSMAVKQIEIAETIFYRAFKEE